MFERDARPADRFVNPYLNDNEARASNNGAYPPDLSVITKARKYGEDYIYNLLIGYEEPPEGIELVMVCITINGWMVIKLLCQNQFMMRALIMMMEQITMLSKLSKDVVTFLKWAAEPELKLEKILELKLFYFS